MVPLFAPEKTTPGMTASGAAQTYNFERYLKNRGLVRESEGKGVKIFATLDSALEWSEERILAAHGGGLGTAAKMAVAVQQVDGPRGRVGRSNQCGEVLLVEQPSKVTRERRRMLQSLDVEVVG